jgi:hypothetical protein
MKTLTRKQLEARKAQAVRFVRDALGDDDMADDIEDESFEDYAGHRHIKLANPGLTTVIKRAMGGLVRRSALILGAGHLISAQSILGNGTMPDISLGSRVARLAHPETPWTHLSMFTACQFGLATLEGDL